jgi:hypothetical protein
MNHRVIVLAILIASFILYGCAGEVQATGTPVEEPAEINAPPVIKDADQPVPAEPKELELQDPLLLSPLDPIPGEDEMIAGPVMVQESELVLMESQPVKVLLRITGNLPTPCHMPRASLIRDDESERIDIELYSLTEEDVMCIQVIQSFETVIPLGEYTSGEYKVYLNGELVGEINV